MLNKLVAGASAAILMATPALGDSAKSGEKDRFTLGWLEHVRIVGLDIELDAKLDTGATTSSIHAVILEKPKRSEFDDEENGRDIIFKVINEDGDERTIDTKIIRWASIKTKKGGLVHRPVVELEFCLGGRIIKDEVTLADRAHFNYETLIGRNMLKSAGIIVDSSDIYTKKARCSE
jgi:hypothetical protein